jgi:hypothetical protein
MTSLFFIQRNYKKLSTAPQSGDRDLRSRAPSLEVIPLSQS